MTASWFPLKGLEKLHRESASRLLHLGRSLRAEPIVLFVGADVLTSSGLPTWTQLMVTICQVFFDHWQLSIGEGSSTIERPPNELSLAFMEPSDAEILALAEDFAKGNPVLVAQQIKNCIRDLDWIYLLRKCLYGDRNSKGAEGSVLIEKLVALCTEKSKVQAVVNYNYDSVLEECLTANNIRFTVLQDDAKSVKRGTLPIYHVHGYLKRGGGTRPRSSWRRTITTRISLPRTRGQPGPIIFPDALNLPFYRHFDDGPESPAASAQRLFRWQTIPLRLSSNK